MSADNFVAIQQIQGRWYVWNESASNELPIVPLDRAKSFRFGFQARRYAKKLVDSMMVVEYGIQELGGYDHWSMYYQHAVDHLQREYWEMVDRFQSRAQEGVH